MSPSGGFDAAALHRMAGAMGWTPADLRAASLAELLAHFDGAAAANGWRKPAAAGMTKARLRELMEAYPDAR